MADYYGPEPKTCIHCAHCDHEYTHQFCIVHYDRAEDGPNEARIVRTDCYLDHIRFDPIDPPSNPSPRRDGIAIGLRCEACSETTWLMIAQHKGNTFTWSSK